MNSSRTIHKLRFFMKLPAPIEQVFGFFSDAFNLERITPPELCFRIASAPPIRIAQGAILDFRLRLFSVPFGWQTKISVWEPPYCFVDEQLHGPYRLWVHTHRFGDEDGFTTITDEVDYALPLWPVGELSHPLVYGQLQRIFRFRQEATRRLLVTDFHLM
jgi:ligand-binding SRPBCC domain-containing protein